MVVGGCVHLVTSGWQEKDLVGSGRTPERGRSRTGVTIPVSRSVGASAIGAARWRGRTTARSSLKVATSRAGEVGAPMHCSGVVEGADGANGRGGGAPGGDVAESPAVFTLSVLIGRVGAFNVS